MKDLTRTIVNPVKTKNSPQLPHLAVMVGSRPDLLMLAKMLEVKSSGARALYNGTLYVGEGFSLAGPMIGAPYAAMILETLLAWGADRILFFGWGGSISEKIHIGDILIPTGAFIDEGTSRHYGAADDDLARPSRVISEILEDVFQQKQIDYAQGAVWSTDAIYRETVQKVGYYQEREAVAVEMELSALFTVGKFRQARVGGILAVSDELSSLTWRPGFRHEKFKDSRKQVCEAIRDICRMS